MSGNLPLLHVHLNYTIQRQMPDRPDFLAMPVCGKKVARALFQKRE